MNYLNLIGIIASIFTGISLLPQLFKIYMDKECSISAGMLVVLFIGNCCWLWYGMLKQDMIIVLSNAFSILVNLCLSILWIRLQSPKN